MAEIFVAQENEIENDQRRIVKHERVEVGVFRWEDSYYAYSNICLHQGGPACEGLVMHEVEDVIGEDKSWRGQTFSRDIVNFVCPWHGYEYNLKTGVCAADPRLRLKSFPVVCREGGVYVIID
jgi:nitrite reductase/ring-hydroxylating ferredoxin subunit